MSGRRFPGGWRRTTWGFAIATLVGLFAVNTIGFVDTETGSAFGCGHQWPLCDGAVIPTHWGLKTLIEFSHRGLVAVTTILLLILAVLAWWRYRHWVEARVLIILAIVFVLLQAALGAVGVVFGDPAWFLALHFGISLLAFSSALLLLLVIRQIEHSLAHPALHGALRTPWAGRRFLVWTWIAIVYTYIAMYIGAYVASTGYGHLFKGWPLPTESYQQAGSALAVDWLHRSIAFGLVALTVVLLWQAIRRRVERPDLRTGSVLAVILVCLQAVSGALLLASNFSLWSFLLHVTFVSFLFSALCYLGLQSLPEPRHRDLPIGQEGGGEEGSQGSAAGQPL